MGMILAAFIWGLAEATLFFIVPDVLLSFIAQRRGWRTAVRAAGATVVGALIGGAFMFLWAKQDIAAVWQTLDLVPFITPGLLDRVQNELAAHGILAMFTGAFTGAPYKIYAALAGSAGLNLPGFLILSAVARGARFLAAIGLTLLASRTASPWLDRRGQTIALAGFWIVFYAIYFAIFS